jgi:hypothetical protein
MSNPGDAQGPKPRRRVAAKTPSRQDAERVKHTLYLDADLSRRFSVHAAMTGMDKSELFAELVRAGCRRFVVSDRERGPGESAESTDAA